MLGSAFSIGASGLRSMQQRVDMHSSNIANANTPGYRRRDAQHIEMLGGGVSTAIQHRFNPATAQRLSELAGQTSFANTQAEILERTSDAVSQAATSMTEAQAKFNESLYTAGLTPDAPGLREVMASQAQAVAAEATFALENLDGELAHLGRDMAGVQAQAEQKMQELADLNQEAFHMGDNSRVRDRQAQVGRELAELMGGEVRFEDNGSATFVLNNQAVVSGSTVSEEFPASVGGKLGAMQVAQGQVQSYRNTMAAQINTFAAEFNNLNSSGVNGAGTAGQPVFEFDGNSLKFTGSANAFSFASNDPNVKDLTSQMTQVSNMGEKFVGLTVTATGDASAAKSMANSKTLSMERADEYQQSQEGVDIDQEMIAMKITQKIYEANAKVIQTADAMLGTLLSIKA